MPLTKQKQAIADILAQKQITQPSNAVTALDIAIMLADAGHFPNGTPDQGAASAMMTNAFRAIPGLHRVKQDGGPAFLYFFNPSQEKLGLEPIRQAPVRTVPNMVPAPVAKVQQHLTPVGKSIKVKAAAETPFVIVKKVDGSFAGVLRNNVLFETLEQLVDGLNGKLLKS